MGNPLADYFHANEGRAIHKWHHYFDVYHHHFAAYRDKPVTIMEFGVSHGGSLQMWKHYFGAHARIVGADIDPRCKQLEEPQVEIHIGDQEDRGFLRELAGKVGAADVVVDDGGHYAGQQLATFEEIFPIVRDGGVFVVEDLHTSYSSHYAAPGLPTFVEHTKRLVDRMHGWHTQDVDDYTTSVRAIHLYESIVVFEKASVVRPRAVNNGSESF